MIFKKRWESLHSVFSELNDFANYAILRNWEGLYSENFLQGHEDVDIICDNPKEVVKALGAVKEPVWGHNSHYYLQCDNKLIEIGIRYVGDNYYDLRWEKEMLATRVFDSKLGAYVLNEEMYLYSLIYHALLHKRKLSDDYFTRLQGMLSLRDCVVNDCEDLLEQLLIFVRKNDFNIVFPKDYTVPFDLRNVGVSQKDSRFDSVYRIVFGEVECVVDDWDIGVDIEGYRLWKLRKVINLPNRVIRVMVRRIRKVATWEKN